MKTFSIKVDPLTNEEYLGSPSPWPATVERRDAQQGVGVHRRGAPVARALGAAAHGRVVARASGAALPRELPAQARRHGEVHLPAGPPQPQRGAVLPAADREPQRDGPHCLHAHGGPGLPGAQPHHPAVPRHLPEPGQHRQHRPDLPERVAAQREPHRRDRRGTHPRPRRSRVGRHGHPGRQSDALCCRRRPAPGVLPPDDARCRHEQPAVARRPPVPGLEAPEAGRRRVPGSSWRSSSSA